MIAAAEALQDRHAAAAQDTSLAGLRAGTELQLGVAVEGRHGERRAERSLRHRQVDGREDVVALAHEPLVAADSDEDVRIARGAADRAGVSLTRDPDPLPVVDPGRDLHVERALLDDPAGAAAVLAGMLDHLSGAGAAGARLGADELAEDAP